MGTSGPNTALNLIFLGLCWPWVGEFVGFIVIVICFPNTLTTRCTNGKFVRPRVFGVLSGVLPVYCTVCIHRWNDETEASASPQGCLPNKLPSLLQPPPQFRNAFLFGSCIHQNRTLCFSHRLPRMDVETNEYNPGQQYSDRLVFRF